MNTSEYLFEHALALLSAGKKNDASDALAEVIRRNPQNGDAWAIRGQIEHEAGRSFNAALHYDMAVKAAPKRYEYWCNYGTVAAANGMPGFAEKLQRKSLEVEDNFEAHTNLGHLYADMMRLEDAETEFRAAIALKPDEAQPHASLGLVLLGLGRHREGFQEHRHRFGSSAYPPRPRGDVELWRGEPIDGKTILLYGEQGFGDELLGIRYVRTLHDMGAYVILSVRPQMHRLAQSMRPWADEVIMRYDTPARRPHYCAALLDVPAFFGELAPASHGYLEAPHRDDRLALPPGLKVGICWASGKRELQPGTDQMARQKTLPFGAFAPLARAGVTLVSLQQSHQDRDALRELGVLDPMGGVNDFADTAWIIDQLDLVITTDTSVAHLAGALGKPVWNLVRFAGLWPWMREDRACSWYDSMTIYRQSIFGDWKEPMGRLMADFDRLVERREAA
jgi:Tfp pilus assembly protein PilF